MHAQTTALTVATPNPHLLRGALVEFPAFSDSFQDVRTSNDTRVSIDNNAGAGSALAGLAIASGSWDQCLQARRTFLSCPQQELSPGRHISGLTVERCFLPGALAVHEMAAC